MIGFGSALARTFVVFPTGTEARAQMEVVDGETGRCKQQTGQNWDGPVDGVVVLGGVNHFFHGGKKLIGLELVDRIVPEQTDRFIWKSQVYFEDRHRQFLKIEIDKMRIDAQGTPPVRRRGCSPEAAVCIQNEWRLWSFDESGLVRHRFHKSSVCTILLLNG